MLPIITELESEKFLAPVKYKDIMVDSVKFLVDDKRITLNAFVIMDNHIHLIWQMLSKIKPDAVQRDFKKYTAPLLAQASACAL